MTGLQWRDLDGVECELAEPAPLRAAIKSVLNELKVDGVGLRSADPAVVADALEKTKARRADLDRLIESAREWDAYAERETIKIAGDVLADMAGVRGDVERLTLIHRCHDRWAGLLSAERVGAEPAHTRSGPASLEQVALIQLAVGDQWRPASIGALTFEAAQAVLTDCPATNREAIPPAVSAFSWTDPDGHVHQVRSLRQIEDAFVKAARDLIALAPSLSVRDDPVALEMTVGSAVKLNATLLGLRANMTAFSDHVDEHVRTFAREYATWLETITI